MTIIQPALCPCCEFAMEATSVHYKLWEILRKWEAHGVMFSKQTWDDYPSDIELTLSSCVNCGFGIFQPTVTGSDSFYSDLALHDYYLPDRWDFHVAAKLMRKVQASSVLDVGCGRGAFLAQVRKLMPDVLCYGTDANPEVWPHLPKGIIPHKRLETVPDELDAVTLFQVIEHVADPEGLLVDAISKLRKGGILIVSVPDHSGPIRFFSDSHTAIPPHHVTLWTPPSLERLCVKNGLKVVARKREPLPNYLMPFYLPKIIANFFGCLGNPISEYRVRRYLADPITKISNTLGVKSLPIQGHTYLLACVFQGS